MPWTEAGWPVELHRPSTLEEVQEIVAAARQVRALGSRHSFNDIAGAAEQVTLRAPRRHRRRAGCGHRLLRRRVTYGELAGALRREGMALHNLASLPHISVAGAVATATHGSGDASGQPRDGRRRARDGDVDRRCSATARGAADFEGMVVGLGALGVVTRLTLDVEPAYEMRQRVFEGLAWDMLFEHFDEIAASGDSSG